MSSRLSPVIATGSLKYRDRQSGREGDVRGEGREREREREKRERERRGGRVHT